jgi:hypothetical protein
MTTTQDATDLLVRIVHACDALVDAEIRGKPDLIEAARSALSARVNETAEVIGTSRPGHPAPSGGRR